MSKTETLEKPETSSTTDEAEEVRVEGTPEQRDNAQQRSLDCHKAIQGVLAEFNCRISPVIESKQVGTGPLQEVILRAYTYWVEPMPVI